MRKLTNSDFIERSIKVHGEKYDYSKSEYTISHNYITITCRDHGDFKVKAYMHMQGSGCRKCALITRPKNISKAAKIKRSMIKVKQPVEYKLIPLTKGKFAKVDNEDFDRLSKINWSFNGKRNYAQSKKHGKMHRYIMDFPHNLQVDHINHDTLDNRKSNLRICTPKQNSHNTRPRPRSSSKYKGVSLFKRNGKWRATINVEGKFLSLGYFFSEKDAAKAYDVAALKYHREFAYLNFPIEEYKHV